MQKHFKKVTSLLLSFLITMMALPTTAKAATATNHGTMGYISAYTLNGQKFNQYGSLRAMERYTVGGAEAYCLEPTVPFDNGSQSVEESPLVGSQIIKSGSTLTMTDDLSDKLGLIAYFGGKENVAQVWTSQAEIDSGDATGFSKRYFFTQRLIWETLGHTLLFENGSYSYLEAQYQEYKATLQKYLKSQYLNPSFNKQTYTMNVGETRNITDTNGIFDIFEGAETLPTGITMTPNGNTISVTATAPGTYTYNKNKFPDTWVTRTPLVYQAGEQQKVSTLYVSDPGRATFDVNVVQPVVSYKITKTDGAGKPLAGAVFTVYDSSGKVHQTVKTTADGTATFTDLVEGATYTYKETTAPTGYVLDATVRTIDTTATTLTATIKNTPINYPLTIKKANKAGTALAGAVYNVFNITKNINIGDFTTLATGQIVATGRINYGDQIRITETKAPNGYILDKTSKTITISTSGNEVSFINDLAISELTIIKKDATSGAGLVGAVFSIKEKNTSTTNDYTTNESGSLIVSNLKPAIYIVKEVKAPTGYVLDPTEHEVDLRYVDQNTPIIKKSLNLTNKRIEIGTTASFIGNYKENHSIDSVTLIDVVSYKGLIVGKDYTVTGKLMDKATNKPILNDGKEVTSSVTFKPETAAGTIEVPFTFNAVELKGKEIVAFEKILMDGKEVAVHEDINDKEQTVKFPKPEIKTKAKVNGESIVHINGVQKLVDTVSYTDLIVGKDYTVSGKLMDKATGNPLLIDGKEITSEATFKATEVTGTIDIVFEFDTNLVLGKEIVVFEKLMYEGRELTAHEDINDIGQTVKFPNPEIRTKAKVNGESIVHINGLQTYVDTVSYTDLIVGKDYTVTGKLMDKATGKPLLIDGKEVTSSVTFKALVTTGAIPIIFSFDTNKVAGKSIVAFEKLMYEGRELTAHEDINDINQTVIFPNPEIKTKAKVNGESIVHINGVQKLVDTVSFTDLIVGKDYTVSGKLMDKATGKPLLIDGKEVTSEETFKATEVTGTIDIVFEFDTNLVLGKEIVVFEKLMYEGRELAVHEDINDIGQTVFFPESRIGTQATINGEKEALAKGTIKLVDTVSFEGLIVGKDYTVSGKLMDKATGKPLLIDGKEVTASTTFKANTTSGSVKVTFKFKGEGLGEKELVVFQEIHQGDLKIAEHKDINDIGQTVKLKTPPALPNTGTTTAVIPVMAGIALLGLGIVLLKRRTRT